MKRLALLPLLLFSLALPLGAVGVRVETDEASAQAAEPVGRAVESMVRHRVGDDLTVTVSDFTRENGMVRAKVTLKTAGGKEIAEEPLVKEKGWEGKMESLLRKQLSTDILFLYPPASDPHLSILYMLPLPEGSTTFREGQVWRAKAPDGTTSGYLRVSEMGTTSVSFDALSDTSIQPGDSLERSPGLMFEGMGSIYPAGGEGTVMLAWPFPFWTTLSVSGLEDRVRGELGLEYIWPLSTLGHSWFLRATSIAASVRFGFASPWAFGSSAAITIRVHVTTSLYLAVSGRIQYYGNQEEEETWLNGYQLLAGAGFCF